jgi:hypothetical protein
VPIAVDRTIIRNHFHFREDQDEQSKQDMYDWLLLVMSDDNAISELVQRGLSSGVGGRTWMMLPTVDAARQWVGERVGLALRER